MNTFDKKMRCSIHKKRKLKKRMKELFEKNISLIQRKFNF